MKKASKYNSAVIVVDCWDKHWDEQTQKYLDDVCPKINEFLNKMRDNSLIIHCLSEINRYNPGAGPNGIRINEEYQYTTRKSTELKKELKEINFPMSYEMDSPDEQNPNNVMGSWKVWTKCHKSIDINENDINTVQENQIYNIIKQNHIKKLYYVGFSANICVLWSRKFSIMQMKNNFDGDIYLVEDMVGWSKLYGDYKLVIDCWNKHICKVVNSGFLT